MGAIKKFVREAVLEANRVRKALGPDPCEILHYDLGLPHLRDGDLAILASRWCDKYGRRYAGEFIVHDAMHWILGAPPTPIGESIVAAFQFKHNVYDRNVGDIVIALSGIAAIRYGGYVVRDQLMKRSIRESMTLRIQNGLKRRLLQGSVKR